MNYTKIEQIKSDMSALYDKRALAFVAEIIEAAFETSPEPVPFDQYLEKHKSDYDKALAVIKYVKEYAVKVSFSDVPLDCFNLLWESIEADPTICLTDDGKNFFYKHHKF